MDINQLNSFALDQRAHIEKGVFSKKYPAIEYNRLIPIDSSADKNADEIVKKIMDAKGFAKWSGAASSDTPMVDFATTYITHKIYSRDIGFTVNRQELARSIQANTNVSTERAIALRDVFERDLNRIALFGDTTKKMDGFYNSEFVGVETVSTNITEIVEAISVTGGTQEAINFFASKINKIQEDTLAIYRPTHIALPLRDYNLLRSTIIPGGGTNTLLPFLESNLSVTFVPSIYLAKDVMKDPYTGASFLDADRMVIFTYDVDVVKFHMPQPLEAMVPYTNNQKVWNYVFEARIGGVEWRVPMTAKYFDLKDTPAA